MIRFRLCFLVMVVIFAGDGRADVDDDNLRAVNALTKILGKPRPTSHDLNLFRRGLRRLGIEDLPFMFHEVVALAPPERIAGYLAELRNVEPKIGEYACEVAFSAMEDLTDAKVSVEEIADRSFIDSEVSLRVGDVVPWIEASGGICTNPVMAYGANSASVSCKSDGSTDDLRCPSGWSPVGPDSGTFEDGSVTDSDHVACEFQQDLTRHLPPKADLEALRAKCPGTGEHGLNLFQIDITPTSRSYQCKTLEQLTDLPKCADGFSSFHRKHQTTAIRPESGRPDGFENPFEYSFGCIDKAYRLPVTISDENLAWYKLTQAAFDKFLPIRTQRYDALVAAGFDISAEECGATLSPTELANDIANLGIAVFGKAAPATVDTSELSAISYVITEAGTPWAIFTARSEGERLCAKNEFDHLVKKALTLLEKGAGPFFFGGETACGNVIVRTGRVPVAKNFWLAMHLPDDGKMPGWQRVKRRDLANVGN